MKASWYVVLMIVAEYVLCVESKLQTIAVVYGRKKIIGCILFNKINRKVLRKMFRIEMIVLQNDR